MRLETHAGVYADPMEIEDVAHAVAGLTEVGAAYVIMSETADDVWYVQAAGTIGEGFIVERRDGSAGDHYRGDRRLTSNELIAVLEGYFRGATDWSHIVSWHHVNVAFGAVRPSV